MLLKNTEYRIQNGMSLNKQVEQADHDDNRADKNIGSYDYTYVNTIARIAFYDDLLSAPRVTEVKPAPTAEFIENLTTSIYEQARSSGGTVPYTVIHEVTENFIHAQFTEVTVSILDGGNTIRFADQGPGIVQKEKAQLPGFTSAIEPMKHYIRGVGSGLPIVREYLNFSQGTITIEDNLGTGAVVTISLKKNSSLSEQQDGVLQKEPIQEIRDYSVSRESFEEHLSHYSASPSFQAQSPRKDTAVARQYSVMSLIPPLSQRERDFLPIFLSEGALGVTDLARITNMAMSSTHSTLLKLEQAGLIEKTVGQKRILTDLGYQVANSL